METEGEGSAYHEARGISSSTKLLSKDNHPGRLSFGRRPARPDAVAREAQVVGAALSRAPIAFGPPPPDSRPPPARPVARITQGSVQIVLIFRLLLKITVDWPFHAISMFLKPAWAP